MMVRKTFLSALTAWLLTGGAVACGGDSGAEDCIPGTEGCACAAPLNQCLLGLQCLSNYCVGVGGSATTPSSDSNSPDTDDPPTTNSPTNDPTNSPTNSPTTNDPTTDTPTSDGPDSEGDEVGGPKILQFLTNVTTINENESVIFTAVVTDPDGVADVIGGSLTSPDGKIAFGAFATSGEEGAYQLSLSWAAIHQAQNITFETPKTVRTFRAEFFDAGGKSAWKTADITLNCDDGERVTPAACGGQCKDLDSDDEHCSSCDVECDVFFNSNTIGRCIESACTPTYQGCVKSSEFINCNETCAALGEACVVGGCNGNTAFGYSNGCDEFYGYGQGDHSCTEKPGGFQSEYACCCTQTI